MEHYTGQEALQRFVDGVSRLIEGRKLQGRREHQGIPISIENRVGSVRKGVDPDGEPWETKMKKAYGYIRGTKGVDGDELDCYVGDSNDAEFVYIIHVKKAPEFKKFDEDKVMLGFSSPEQAKRVFKQHYDDPKFYGGMTQVPTDQFKKLLDTLSSKSMKLDKDAIDDWAESMVKDFKESKKPVIYYARSVDQYGSKQEAREVAQLRKQYPGHRISFGRKSRHKEAGMGYYHDMVENADMVVVSPRKHGRLSLGVYSEAQHARHEGIPVRILRAGKTRGLGKLKTKEGGLPWDDFAIARPRKKSK